MGPLGAVIAGLASARQLAVPQRGTAVAWLGLPPHGLVAPI